MRRPLSILPAPSLVWGSPSQPVALYQNDFEQAPYAMPYTGVANTHAYISNSSWTNSRTTDTTWTTYAGVSNAGHSLALPSSAPETSTIRLTFDVDPGYELNVSSFSFYHRSSYTGYQNYSLTINGIPVSPPSIIRCRYYLCRRIRWIACHEVYRHISGEQSSHQPDGQSNRRGYLE
ncbi:hypothetical protein ACDQ55_18950 [Chitinophaga sp. 30R24]|uniref:hypothetical protein n=1 Tax=Chitinophaga sp. 30R24 TaxID=3248838 RepID=UPI003B8FF1DD